jgi:hypothetical protein
MGTARRLPGVAGLVTQGYGGCPPEFVEEAIQRAIRKGRSGDKRYLEELEEIVVWAKLVQVNNRKPEEKIEGSVRVKVDSNTKTVVQAEHFRQRVRNAIERIKVTVKRLK